MGRDVTLSLLVARMFFPCMKGEVAGYIEACRTCQTKHGKGADQRHTLRSVPAGYPFQRIHIDLVGPLNKGARTGASNILTVRDTFTKWVEAIPLTATTTLEVARALKREIFSRYGYPETIHFDLGPQFTSQFFLDLGKTLDIQITDTTGYNPKSNGQVERMHRDLGAIIRAALRDNPKASWEDKLPQALFALRTAVCRSTGLAPYQLLFGRDCSTPIDLLFGRPEDDDIDKGGRQHRDYLRRLRMRIDAAQRYARRNMAEAVIRQRRQYHLERKSFRPGIKVWLLTPSVKPGTARKLANPWSGPWVVCVDGVNNVMVRILPHPDWSDSQATRVMSIKRLKLYGDGAAVRPPSDDADLDMAGDEYVEHVDNGGAGTPLPPPRRQPPVLRLYPLPGLQDRLEPRDAQQARLRREKEHEDRRARADRGEQYRRRERQELEERAEAKAAERRDFQRQLDNDRRLEDKTNFDGNAVWSVGKRNGGRKKNDGPMRSNGARKNPGSRTREGGKGAAKGN